MSRKKKIYKRRGQSTELDAVYQDHTVLQLINRIMKDGKKSLAEKICYTSLKRIKEITGINPLMILLKAIENIKPSLELRSVKMAKSTFQIPYPLHEKRKLFFATKWLVESSNDRRNNDMISNLTSEIIDASQNKGKCVEKKQRLHKMAEANRAYLRYRW